MTTQLKSFLAFIGTLAYLLIGTSVNAQSPQAIPYQAVARDVSGNILSNQNISLRITLIDSNVNSIDYQETHQVTTNSLGLFTLNIGQGAPVIGTLSGIYWPISGNEHVQVEMDPSGGTNYVNMGIAKLNSVPFALHANTSSDNKWNANGTNIYNNNAGKVGIGTSAPSAKLDVNGMAFFRNNTGGLLSPSAGAGVKITTEGNQGNIFGFNYSNLTPIDLVLQSAGGKLGVGTNYPQADMHVYHPNNATEVTIGGQESSFATQLKLATSANSSGYSSIQSIQNSGFNWGNLMLNESGGNVGIGTNNPTAKLQVDGNVRINDGSQASGKILTSDANGLASWQSPAAFVESDPKVGTLSNNKIPKWNGTSLSNGSITDNANKIGIGTSTPSEQLHTTGGVRHESLSGVSRRPVYADANGKLFAGNDTSLSMTVAANLNYVINNTNSIGTISGWPTTVNTSGLTLTFNGSNNDPITVFLQAPNGEILDLFNSTVANEQVTFADQASQSLPSSGNIFGAFKPAGNMTTVSGVTPTVNSFSSFGGGTINPNGTWTIIVIVQANTFGFNLNNWTISYHDANLSQGTTNYLPVWNNGNLTSTSSVFDNGNVGIKTTTPQRALDVHGDIAQGLWTDNLPSRRIGVMDASTHVAGMEIENTTLNGNYSQKLHLLTHHYANGFGRRFTIDEDGNVGIGTETPSSLLHVNGRGQFGNYLKIGTNIPEGYFQNAQDGAYRALQTGGNQGYYFQNYNGVNTAMFVGLNGTYQGKVGINTATPSNALSVNGSEDVSGNLAVSGTISSPKFKVTQVWNQVANLPSSSSFVSSGGTVFLCLSGMGYRTTIGSIGANILIDGVNKGTVKGFASATSFQSTMSANFLVLTGITTGTHTIQLTAISPTLFDANSYFSCSVLELPF